MTCLHCLSYMSHVCQAGIIEEKTDDMFVGTVCHICHMSVRLASLRR